MSNVLIVNFKNNVKWRGTVDRETAIHLKTSFQQISGWAWTELAWIELEECSSSELNKWIIHRCKPVMIGYPSTVDTVNQNKGALQTLARLHKHWTQNHWKKKVCFEQRQSLHDRRWAKPSGDWRRTASNNWPRDWPTEWTHALAHCETWWLYQRHLESAAMGNL